MHCHDVFISASKNLALDKPAWQSSLDPLFNFYGFDDMPGWAVDGDMASVLCTHTDEEPRPWWRVDLLQEYMVTEVLITSWQDYFGGKFSEPET